MSEDLEKTLAELGHGYGDVVSRLKAAREIEPRRRPLAVSRRQFWRPFAAVAASLLFATLLTSMVIERGDSRDEQGALALLPRNAYSLAFNAADKASLDEIKRTQNADGSWQNDYLTRQNAAALREIDSSSVTYRKAVRYLKSRGLDPLSRAELLAAESRAASRF